MVRAYKLTFTGTSTASNTSNLQVPRSGTILGVSWNIYGAGPADVTGRMMFELSTASVTTTTTNDTPGNSLSSCCISGGGIASAGTSSNHQHPIGVSINAGDKLYIHILSAGTAFGTIQGACTVFVNH